MFGLAAILEGLVGPWFKAILLPVLLLSLLTASHLAVEGWKGRLRSEGVAVCNADWERKIREEERRAATLEREAARILLLAEQETNRELSTENEEIAGKLQAALAGSAGDKSCLSGGVLDALRGQAKHERGKSGS